MRALIVDDSSAMRKIMGRILEKAGFEIDLATDGRNALSVLSEIPMPQVALVDWNMPEMSGIEFLRTIKADPDLKEVPVIMLTTESERRKMIEATESGAQHYLTKPFQPETLATKILQCAGPS